MPQKPLIDGDLFRQMCDMAECHPGQPVGLVFEGGIYSVGVIAWADLNQSDWMRPPVPVAEKVAEETIAVPNPA